MIMHLVYFGTKQGTRNIVANTLGMTAKVSQYSNQGNHAKKCRAVVLAVTLRKQVNQNSLGVSFRLGFEGWPGGANERQVEEE